MSAQGEKKPWYLVQCKSLDTPLIYSYFASKELDFVLMLLKYSQATIH